MVRDLPTWLRGTVLGLWWGAGCGAAAAGAMVLARIVTGGTNGDNAYQLLVGVPLEGGLICCAGAIGGAVVGSATGLVAGLVLTIAVRVSRPAVASVTTIVAVLIVQAMAEVAISGRPTASNLWAYAAAPAITIVPLTYGVLRHARTAHSVVPA